ncbi:uncharacterized protein Tco025E_01095, partial [Trypanosoma conorhini]
RSGATAIAAAEALGLTETSDRDAIVQAEEAGRRAALGAARSGATAIAAAEALGLTETSGRDAIVQAEEAGRRAALGAARSGATAIAAAEALGLTETSGRDAIVQAEEAGRGLICDSFYEGCSVVGVHDFCGGAEVRRGVKTATDTTASWPSRVGGLNLVGAECVGRCAPADAALPASEECHVSVAAASSAGALGVEKNALTSVSEANALEGWGGAGLASWAAGALPAEVEVEAADEGRRMRELAVHPALRAAAVRTTRLPHGEPLGYDSDDDIPIPQWYTFWGCLITPFACCMGRRPVHVSHLEDSASED